MTASLPHAARQKSTTPFNGYLANRGNAKVTKNNNDDLSAMREIWLTQTFLKNVSRISRRIVNADDEQLFTLIRTSIEMSDKGLTHWRTDEIQYATLGIGNELSVFFIKEEIPLHRDDGVIQLPKYTFLAAIADDVEINRKNHTSDKSKSLKYFSRLTIKAVVINRVYDKVKEAIAEVFAS